MIERLAVAASIAVRHAGAYTELILCDVDSAGRSVRRRIAAGAVLAVSGLLALVMACVWILALAWDTAGRNWAIGGLLVLFTLVAGFAFRTLRELNAQAPGVLSRTAHEWAKDRQLLEELIEREREREHEASA